MTDNRHTYEAQMATAEAVRVVLAETDPEFASTMGVALRRDGNGDWVIRFRKGGYPTYLKAARIAHLQLHGPEYRVICDNHQGPNAYELWDQCQRVPVRDAMIGHTCA